MDKKYAAGASAARNKIASHLTANGIPVFRSGDRPPTDDDFLRAVQRSQGGTPDKARNSKDDDVVSVVCDRVKTHSTTIQYTAELEGTAFRPYLPKSILPRGRHSSIGVALSPNPQLLPASQGDLVGGELVEYTLVDRRKHSLVYEWISAGPRRERLYVPRGFFGPRTRHERLFIRVYA